MEIKEISLSEIKPSKYNPRVISNKDKSSLVQSISYFGLIDPLIIVTKTKEIIGGHQRYDALKEKNINKLKVVELGDISVVFSDEKISLDSENDVKALNIALNKIQGEWDNDKLNSLLHELNDVPSFDFDTIGFSNGELDLFHLTSLNEEAEKFFDNGFGRESEEELQKRKERYNSFVCGGVSIPLDDETYSLLGKCFKEYSRKEHDKEWGFITYLLSG